MKFLIIIIAFSLIACGDVGSSTSSTTVDQNTVQGINLDPVNCSVSCKLDAESGDIDANGECSGGGLFPVVVQGLDDCDTILETE